MNKQDFEDLTDSYRYDLVDEGFANEAEPFFHPSLPSQKNSDPQRTASKFLDVEFSQPTRIYIYFCFGCSVFFHSETVADLFDDPAEYPDECPYCRSLAIRPI